MLTRFPLTFSTVVAVDQVTEAMARGCRRESSPPLAAHFAALPPLPSSWRFRRAAQDRTGARRATRCRPPFRRKTLRIQASRGRAGCGSSRQPAPRAAPDSVKMMSSVKQLRQPWFIQHRVDVVFLLDAVRIKAGRYHPDVRAASSGSSFPAEEPGCAEPRAGFREVHRKALERKTALVPAGLLGCTRRMAGNRSYRT